MEQPVMEEKLINGFPEYEVKNCLDTLIQAEEIKSDPKKMKAIMTLVKTKKEAIDSIEGLRERYKEVVEEEMEDE